MRNKKYNKNFNKMFSFFFLIYRKKVITFCGINIDSIFKICFRENGKDAKQCFQEFENGKYKNCNIIHTRHPRILRSVIFGKKGWGLWKDEWGAGIAEGSFTQQEILSSFSKAGIIIPYGMLIEFNNAIYKKFIHLYKNQNI